MTSRTGQLEPGADEPEPAEVAREIGLRYVSDSSPGIRRKRRGSRFSYVGPEGGPVRDSATLQRIRSLAIPPAWSDVWICLHPRGHIQATGRDARGRKQYRYHPGWREARDLAKYDSLEPFATALPALRDRIAEDMARHGLCREKVLATAVALIEATLIRVGNDEYLKANGSYGLTTLRRHHVTIRGEGVSFVFTGKSGKEQELGVRDRRIARVIRRCQDLPGQHLLQYRGADGSIAHVTSDDVNDYLRGATGMHFSARTFRTWGASVLMAKELAALGPPATATAAKQNVLTALKTVASRLGNTVAVCRNCYVHPEVTASYLDGTFPHRERRNFRPRSGNGLGPDERFLLRVLNGEAATRVEQKGTAA